MKPRRLRSDGVSEDDDELQRQVARQTKRLRKAERERRSLLAESAYIGTLGLLLVLPPVGGAYLGRWLDEQLEGYSSHWTLSLILVGLMVGVINVYLNLRD